MTIRWSSPRRATFGVCLTLVSLLCTSPASRSEAGAGDDGTLSLSVTIESRHTSHFEVCIPVRVNEPFRIVWGNERVKDSVSGLLHPAEKGEYPITLDISEGGGSCRQMTKPKLKVGEPDEWANLVSLAFNHIDKRKFVLSKGGCK